MAFLNFEVQEVETSARKKEVTVAVTGLKEIKKRKPAGPSALVLETSYVQHHQEVKSKKLQMKVTKNLDHPKILNNNSTNRRLVSAVTGCYNKRKFQLSSSSFINHQLQLMYPTFKSNMMNWM